MLTASKPANETERIKALHDLQILDTPINPIFERITRLTKGIFKVPIVAISIIDRERQWFKSTQGINVCENDLNTSFCAHAILQNDLFIVQDSHKEPRFADNPMVTQEPYVRFYAGCPIHTTDGFNIGTLCIIDNQPRELSDDEKVQLKDLATLVQDELQKYKHKYSESEFIKQLDQAKRAKLIDSLTGVWNREGCEINIKEHLILANNSREDFLLAILDIDNFKRVNDTFGHNAGDDVIREVVKRMVMSLDESDVVGRWGGEEFIILANITDSIEKIFDRIDKARESVASEPIVSDENIIPVSVTIGITTCENGQNITSEQLVAQADKALYKGKNSGKNKCLIYRDDY